MTDYKQKERNNPLNTREKQKSSHEINERETSPLLTEAALNQTSTFMRMDTKNTTTSNNTCT